MNITEKHHLETTPYLIQEGTFGATVQVNNQTLFLRMELLTENNTKNWTRFKKMSYWVANQNSNGVLSTLVSTAGEDTYFEYEDAKKVTGFTEEEYKEFTEKAIRLKEKTNKKIVQLIAANCVGTNHMYTGSAKSRYIAYVSKNPNFSIQDAGDDITGKEFTLKNFINDYSDILISVGSDFSAEDSFHNRGISRNSHWVFEEKYSGLSMLLLGFTGAIAANHFPEKKTFHVLPVGSMQCIIKKSLLQGEGYMMRKEEKIDLTSIEVSESKHELGMNYIKISALTRIYLDQVSKKTK